MNSDFRVIVLMGVSGCGKTSVGQLLAGKLGWEYLESDEYHSREDIRKISSGIPLTDADRLPWLKKLNGLLREANRSDSPVILACSALKAAYRRILAERVDGLVFVHLKGDYALIYERMQKRRHFMGADMLRSQFEILEETPDLIEVDIREGPEKITNQIMKVLSVSSKSGN